MEVTDLRSALVLLETMPGNLVTTDVEVDPEAELSGLYQNEYKIPMEIKR